MKWCIFVWRMDPVVLSSNTSSGFGQEKVTKEKATPVSRAMARSLCCLLDLGGCGTRFAETKNVSAKLKQSSPTSPRSSELLGATRGPQPRNAGAALNGSTRSAKMQNNPEGLRWAAGLSSEPMPVVFQGSEPWPTSLYSRKRSVGGLGWVGRIRQQETGCAPWVEKASLSAITL